MNREVVEASVSTTVTPPSPSISPALPENITLTCISDNCLSAITVVLDSIGEGKQGYLTLNFQVTNTSPDVCQMSFNSLLLQEENSNHAPYQAAGPGRDNNVTLQAKPSVPISPYFPQAPLKGRFDLQQVGLKVTCPQGGTVIMSYANVVGIGR